MAQTNGILFISVKGPVSISKLVGSCFTVTLPLPRIFSLHWIGLDLVQVLAYKKGERDEVAGKQFLPLIVLFGSCT